MNEERHYVRDYTNYVQHLKATQPLNEAMSEAVGGGYEFVGSIERDLLVFAGLKDGMNLVDFGCGSGRLASQLGATMNLEYLGIDVVQDLLDYSASRTPDHFKYLLNHGLDIPTADASADFVCSFSVFTHLKHSETYIYLEEMKRCLKNRGRIVASFLEFADPAHWPAFETNVMAERSGGRPHLDQFIERGQFAVWAERLELRVIGFIGGREAPWPSGNALGQATVMLEKND